MRIRAWLKRRYTLPQTAAIFLPSVALSMTATYTLALAGMPKPAVTAISFIVLFAVFAITAALIDHRTRG